VAHAIASCFVVLGLGYGIERRARELIHALIWTMFRVCVCVCVWAWAFECMIDMGWKILHMIWKVLGHPPISRLPVRITQTSRPFCPQGQTEKPAIFQPEQSHQQGRLSVFEVRDVFTAIEKLFDMFYA
jgi:hypothetical protein